MSQNMFGQPTEAEPEVEAPDLTAGSSRKKLFLGGAVGLAAVAILGAGAFVLTSGDSSDPTSAPVAAPVATATAEPTAAPAPLPTLAQFNGRNPFKAKIVAGGGGGGGAGAGGAAPGGAPTGGTTTASGVTVGADGKVVSLPGRDGQDGQDGQDGKDGKDGKDGASGRDGVDASALYAVLTGVTPDPVTGELTVEIALGVGSEFELFQVTLPASGVAGVAPDLDVWAPGKWVNVHKAADVPGGTDAGDTATIRFGDRVVELSWMKAAALL